MNLNDLHMSVRQGCLDKGSSSNAGGTCPYIISQLISSKSKDWTDDLIGNK